MLAAAPGSHMGRYLYEVQLCPGQTNEKNKESKSQRSCNKDGWQYSLNSFSLTLTASKIRMALAWSFSLRQALRAASRIFGSGTRSYPTNVFTPETSCRFITEQRQKCIQINIQINYHAHLKNFLNTTNKSHIAKGFCFLWDTSW